MKLPSALLHAAVLLALAAPAAAQNSFVMDFDNIPKADPPPPQPDQELGSAVLGFYNGDPVYDRGGPSWNIEFSVEALAICYEESQIPGCSGNFPEPPSPRSAVATVTTDFFEFRVTPGLYVQALSFDYTDAGPSSNPGVVLFSDGALLGNPILLSTCEGAFCGWKPYTVSAADLAQGFVTSVRFLGEPNAVAFDNIAVTTAAIPEPSTYALMLGGLALVAGVARRRRRG